MTKGPKGNPRQIHHQIEMIKIHKIKKNNEKYILDLKNSIIEISFTRVAQHQSWAGRRKKQWIWRQMNNNHQSEEQEKKKGKEKWQCQIDVEYHLIYQHICNEKIKKDDKYNIQGNNGQKLIKSDEKL